MAQHQPIRKNTPPPGSEIPDKLYFRIGEVSRLCDLPAYVLRFWESEFPQLKPHKGGTGQRLYRRRDVETVLHIKSLLYDEGYTIPGARQVIKTEQRQKSSQLALEIEAGPATSTNSSASCTRRCATFLPTSPNRPPGQPSRASAPRARGGPQSTRSSTPAITRRAADPLLLPPR